MVAVRDSHSIAICQKQDGGHFYHVQSVSHKVLMNLRSTVHFNEILRRKFIRI